MNHDETHFVPILTVFIYICLSNQIYGVLHDDDNSTLIHLTDRDLIKFEHTKSDAYSNMLLINNFLYLSGTNYVFKLNSLNISDKSEEFYKERSILPTIDHQQVEQDLKSQSKNYVKFLGSRDTLNDLIICGTNLGRPHLYDLKETDLSNQLEYNGNSLCSAVFNQTSLGLISFDANYLKHQRVIKGVMYSAIWQSQTATDVYSRYGIYRKEIEFNRNFVKSLSSPHWLWSPYYIAIIEDVEFVYYFFSEYSVEEYRENFAFKSQSFAEYSGAESKLTRVSRVARICKSDPGMASKKHPFLNSVWTSFRKIKIECACNRNATTFGHLLFIKSLESDLNTIVGVFYHGEKGADFSVICEFDVGNLRNRLKTKQFWPGNARHTDILKCDPSKEPEKSSTRENQDYFDEDSVPLDLEDFYLYLSENTLLNAKFVGVCKLILPFRVTALASAKSAIYLSTSDNKITQVNTGKEYEVGFSFSLASVIPSIESVNELIVDPKGNTMYLATFHGVYQLSLERLKELSCNKNEYCSVCVAMQGCKWSDKCVYDVDLRNSKECPAVVTEAIAYSINETAILKCGNFTKPILDSIYWFKDELEIANGLQKLRYYITKETDLILVNLNPEDFSGVYTCKIDKLTEHKRFRLEIIENALSNTTTNRVSDCSELETNRIRYESIEVLVKTFEDWKKEQTAYSTKLSELEKLFEKNGCS